MITVMSLVAVGFVVIMVQSIKTIIEDDGTWDI